MMDVRLPCISANCEGTILPITSEQTGGYCMPCFKKKKREAEEEYIRNNRKNINLYADLTSPVEIIKTFHRAKVYDPLIYYEPFPDLISKRYQSLNNEHIRDLVEYLTNLYKTQNREEAKKIATCLVAFTEADVTILLEEMIKSEDYEPAFLFTRGNLDIQKQLLEQFLDKEDPESDLFKSIAWLIEKGPKINNKVHSDLQQILTKYNRVAFIVKNATEITRKNGFKQSILGNINIRGQHETWPVSEGTFLNPVIQLAVSDLAYIPNELEGIKYICVYIHPDDAGAMLDRNDALIIRTYTNDDLIFLEAPTSIKQATSPRVLEFEKIDDYPCDYLYPSPLQYLEHSVSESVFSKNKEEYNWDAEFKKGSETKPWCNDFKILGWPRWIQDPEDYDDSQLILQVDGYGLWEYGDTSILYIFRNKLTKEFWGTLQMA